MEPGIGCVRRAVRAPDEEHRGARAVLPSDYRISTQRARVEVTVRDAYAPPLARAVGITDVVRDSVAHAADREVPRVEAVERGPARSSVLHIVQGARASELLEPIVVTRRDER